jgi:hypothetical protein
MCVLSALSTISEKNVLTVKQFCYINTCFTQLTSVNTLNHNYPVTGVSLVKYIKHLIHFVSKFYIIIIIL